MAKKNNNAIMNFAVFVVFPLVAVNVYAYIRVSRSSGHWISAVTSLSEPLSQLALVLALNVAVLIVLTIVVINK